CENGGEHRHAQALDAGARGGGRRRLRASGGREQQEEGGTQQQVGGLHPLRMSQGVLPGQRLMPALPALKANLAKLLASYLTPIAGLPPLQLHQRGRPTQTLSAAFGAEWSDCQTSL